MLQVQKSVVGEFDLCVAETCNYIQKHTYRFLFLIILLFFLVFPLASVFFHSTSCPANCLETDVEQFWIIIGGTLQAMEFVDAKMCGHALLIHTNHCDSGSLEEA